MRLMPDNCYDLGLVDVNYGINASKGTWGSTNKGKVTNYGKKDWDKTSPCKEYFDQLIRVSKNQIIWGGNHFISKIPYDSSCWLVWDKDNTGDFADCELAWTSFDSAVRKFRFRWNGMIQENMKNKEIRIHPTQKPVQLYKWILTNYAKKGDKILDTHFGSLSIGIACHDLGFDLDAWELDKDYFEAGKKRLETHQLQLSIAF
jgi:site-specific DNA-methyltransferase (adenine-specific)